MIGSIGVCSWSLRASSPGDLVERLARTGVGAVQLALEPLRSGVWDVGETRDALDASGVRILSGMFEPAGEDYATPATIRATGGLRPDATWDENLERAKACARLAADLGLELVTFHAGFLPHEKGDPERSRLIERLRVVADVFAQRGVRLGLETGQETADTLVEVLDEAGRQTVGVNFDPANMILYAMGDPIAAFERLAPRVWQVHLKDATPATEPGAWGTEVAVGSGVVDWEAFGRVLGGLDRRVDAVLEREAGEDRVGDLREGLARLGSVDAFGDAVRAAAGGRDG